MLPNSARITYAVSILGWIAGAIYYVALAFAHQSFVNDAMILVMFGAIMLIPVSIVVLCPAWLLIPQIVRASSSRRKWLLTVAAIALPTVAMISGEIDQPSDWDELLLFVVPCLPAVAAVIWLAFVSKSNSTLPSG